MNKQQQKRLAKIFVLVDLLVTELDAKDLTPTPQTKRIQDKGNELNELILPVLSRFYDGSPKNSTFFITLAKKFDFIFEKEYK